MFDHPRHKLKNMFFNEFNTKMERNKIACQKSFPLLLIKTSRLALCANLREILFNLLVFKYCQLLVLCSGMTWLDTFILSVRGLLYF